MTGKKKIHDLDFYLQKKRIDLIFFFKVSKILSTLYEKSQIGLKIKNLN